MGVILLDNYKTTLGLGAGGSGSGGGSLFEFSTPPDLSTWTWVNQGSSTLTQQPDGSWHLGKSGPLTPVGQDLSAVVTTAPATPYTVTLCFIPLYIRRSSTGSQAGFYWRESATGELVGIVGQLRNAFPYHPLSVINYDDESTINAIVNTEETWGTQFVWLRCSDDGVNRTSEFSLDGVNFGRLFQTTSSNFLTADQIGIGINFTGTLAQEEDLGITLISWEIT